MIASADTALILFDDCKRLFALDTFLRGSEPTGEVVSERIVIFAKRQTPGKIWDKNYVEVNICVPDETDGEPGQVRLQELERMAHEYFDDGVVGTYDGTTFSYSPDSIGIEQDTSLRCHYVNVRMLFKIFDAASIENN